MRRYSAWSPTTEPLPRGPKFRPCPPSARPPTDGVVPLVEAPIHPGWWVVRLVGAYRPSLVEYRSATEINDDFAVGVAFYPWTPAYPFRSRHENDSLCRSGVSATLETDSNICAAPDIQRWNDRAFGCRVASEAHDTTSNLFQRKNIARES